MQWTAAIGSAVLLAVAAYSNCFAGVFVFDDISEIQLNSGIRRLWPPTHAMFHGGRMAHRPVPYYTFALNYAAHGLELSGYHLVNLAIHVAAGLVLLALVELTLRSSARTARYSRSALPLGWAAACLWLAHPLQTQAVTYIYQRMESLMALLYLLTIYCFARSEDSARPKMWLVLSVAACALGMACKEVMVTAPVMVLLYDKAFRGCTFAQIVRRRGAYYLSLFATWGVLVGVIWTQSLHYDELGTPAWSIRQYALNQPAVIFHYLKLCLWPSGLCFDYGWQPAHSFSTLALPLAGILVLVGVGWAMRFRCPPVAFLIGFFLLVLAPTSSVLPLNDLCAEHRMYLPLCAVVLGVLLLLHEMLMSAVRGVRASGGIPAVIGVALVIGIASLLGGITHWRNTAYHSRVAYWSEVVAKAPANPRGHQNLGIAFSESGRLTDALACLRKAAGLDPDNPLLRYNLGSTLLTAGYVGQAIEELQRAVRLDPTRAVAVNNLGLALKRAGRIPEAEERFREAIRIGQDLPEPFYNLGTILVGTPGEAECERVFREALARDPHYVPARRALGMLLARQGRPGEARRELLLALRSDPEDAEVHVVLGTILLEEGVGDPELARRHFRMATRLAPDHARAWKNLADGYAREGRLELAVEHYRRSLKADPELQGVKDALNAVLAATRGGSAPARLTPGHQSSP